MDGVIGRVLDSGLTASALVVAGLLLWQHCGGDSLPPGPADARVQPAVWSELIESDSLPIPPASQRVLHLVLFADFECPACRQFVLGPLKDAKKEFGRSLHVIHLYWPLVYHRFALPAAKAAECAREQGRFEQMVEELYESQDSLGLKSFREIAAAADVPGLDQFEQCNQRPGAPPEVARDDSLRMLLPVVPPGTPTIIFEGIQLGKIPNKFSLDSMISRELADNSQ